VSKDMSPLMTVQTLRGTRSFPDGRGAVSCRSLVARSRAGLHFGLLADRDLDPPLGAMRAALEDAMHGRFAPPDRG
jgi:hypothetical protein